MFRAFDRLMQDLRFRDFKTTAASGDVTEAGAAVDTAIDYIFEAIAWAKRMTSCFRSGSPIV